MPAGRKPKLNWTKCLKQYTTCIDGVRHRLGPDKEAAEKQFRFLMNKASMGETADANPTFAEIADQWLEHVQANHDAERYRLCTARLGDFVSTVGEKIRVRDLQPRHVERWLEGKDLAPGTRRLYSAMVLACLNWAAGKRVRLIAHNPLKGLVELPEGGSRGEDAVWPKELFDQVLRVANPAFANVVRILAWTGARPSTICRVEARHYLPKLRLWDVEDLYRGRVSRKKHVRRVRLSGQAILLVEELNKKHPEGPIFRNSHGEPWTPDTLGVYFHGLRHKFQETKILKWPKGIILYGLRHTFATAFLAEHPNEIEYLRILLGHKDYKMIFKHYGHLIDQHEPINKRLEGFDPFGK